jgi:predicted transcriptional regulator
VESRLDESKKYYKAFDSMPAEDSEALYHLQDSLKKVEQEVSALESRLNDLYALKQLILSRLHKIGTSIFNEDERRILYKIIEESPRSIEELSELLGEREPKLRQIITNMKGRIDRDDAASLFQDLN